MPMWRNGRRNGLKIRWAEQARVGSSPAIGKTSELDRIYKINSNLEEVRESLELDRINKINRIRISLIVSIL
jgi:hypothetical protein